MNEQTTTTNQTGNVQIHTTSIYPSTTTDHAETTTLNPTILTEVPCSYESPDWCKSWGGTSRGASVFNLLTMPNLALVSKLPEPEVKTGNLKDESKIAEKLSKAKAEQIEDMAFNPLWGRCAGICIRDVNFDYTDIPGRHCMALTENSDAAEYDLLVYFFKSVAARTPVALSWTGLDFEIPFIWQRAMILGVPASLIPATMSLSVLSKLENINYSIREMCSFAHKSERLGVLAEMLLEEKQTELSAPVQDLVVVGSDGRGTVLEHCHQNVNILTGLLRRFAGFLIPPTAGMMV